MSGRALDLKPGDKAFKAYTGIGSRYGSGEMWTVERITPTGRFVFTNGHSAMPDGRIIGSSFGYVQPVTDELLAAINLLKLQNAAYAAAERIYDNARRMTAEQCDAVIKLAAELFPEASHA